jgi:hypothetical protein
MPKVHLQQPFHIARSFFPVILVPLMATLMAALVTHASPQRTMRSELVIHAPLVNCNPTSLEVLAEHTW